MVRRVKLAPANSRKQEENNSTGSYWQPKRVREGNGKMRCWVCDKMGHISRECWKIRLQRTRTPSPMFRRPPDATNRAAGDKGPTRSMASKGMARGGDSLTVEGVIDGKRCTITLDTGTSKTIVRADLVNDEIQPMEEFKVQTATGESIAVKGKKEVVMRIGNGQFRHEVLVADIVDEAILGMDFMARNGFALDFGRGTLCFDNVMLPLHLNSGEPIVRRIVLKEQSQLPSNSEGVSCSQLEKDNTGRLVKATKRKHRRKKEHRRDVEHMEELLEKERIETGNERAENLDLLVLVKFAGKRSRTSRRRVADRRYTVGREQSVEKSNGDRMDWGNGTAERGEIPVNSAPLEERRSTGFHKARRRGFSRRSYIVER